jgi:DNA helicase-2/ATP-dependent DNA helicase PcrA
MVSADLLADLTPEQQQAVTATEGPVLILAGAGSGKTRVLTRRIAYLISGGVEPASILAITFTNKAAGEMRARVEQLMGRRLVDFGRLHHQGPTICTFHSLCLRILRHYGEILGVPRNFHIFDTSDQSRLMKQVLKDLDVSSTNFPPGNVLAAISNAKNALTTAPEFAAVAGDFFQRTVARAYTKYEEELARNEALDFDDLILRVVHGMKARPDVLTDLQRHFQYLHIDEYQDTNRAQYILAHVLAARHGNLCVVGDPDQSIYAWRGADIRNILDFESDYPGATVVRLERNYRSTATILSLADALIANNTERKDKKLIAVHEAGEPATLLLCQDEHDEAREVASTLLRLQRDSGHDWSDMAVFYRMNALTRVMEESLRREKIPYQIARGVEFYNRKEIKDALAYLRVVANPADEVSLTRIINTPTRGISDATVRSLQAFAVARGIGLWEAMRLAGQCQALNARAHAAVARFVQQVQRWRPAAAPADAATDEQAPADLGMFSGSVASGSPSLPTSVRALLETIVRQSGLEAFLHKIGGEEKQELANINELISSAAEFDAQNPSGTLGEFLHGVALVSDVDHLKGAGGAVTLMTLHAAKGLEFPVVAIIGWEEGCLPHSRARDSLRELEEERRLAFVGITRAQKRLILSRAVYRTIRGIRERTIPSPFLAELPEEKITVVDRTSIADLTRAGGGAQARQWQRQAMSTEGDRLAGRYRVGQRVRHDTFGTGRIVDLTGGTNAKVIVNFDRAGQKTLILEYAASKLMPL